jgi:hypothetical protein
MICPDLTKLHLVEKQGGSDESDTVATGAKNAKI